MAVLTPYDRLAAEACLLQYTFKQANNQPVRIEFQFAPKVLTDNVNLEWDEKTAGYYGETLIPKSIKNRKLRLEWSYLVGFDNWPLSRILTNLHNFRSYPLSLLRTIQNNANPNNIKNNDTSSYIYIVSFMYPAITGTSPFTFAMSNMDVKYADTKYVFKTANNQTQVFPTKVDCSCDLKMWFNNMLVKDGKKLALDQDLKQKGPLGLKTIPPFEWY